MMNYLYMLWFYLMSSFGEHMMNNFHRINLSTQI